jgi:hypothetical protein
MKLLEATHIESSQNLLRSRHASNQAVALPGKSFIETVSRCNSEQQNKDESKDACLRKRERRRQPKEVSALAKVVKHVIT